MFLTLGGGMLKAVNGFVIQQAVLIERDGALYVLNRNVKDVIELAENNPAELNRLLDKEEAIGGDYYDVY
jgi:hypothetical protein